MFTRFLGTFKSTIIISITTNHPPENSLSGVRTTFPATRNTRLMASGGQFPPQKQEGQPGKEHVMDPNPQFINPDYKPANKLQVLN